MHGRPVRVAVDQKVHLAQPEQGGHGLGIHVHDVLARIPGVGATAGARLHGQPAAHRQRQCQVVALHAGFAHELAELLVARVVGAQQVAMRYQKPAAAGIDADRIGQQAAAAAPLEARPQQEVAVAPHDMAGHLPGVFTQRCTDAAAGGLVVIVTHPGLEQVAEDVQRSGIAGRALQEVDELRHRCRGMFVQVQVGHEQDAVGGHRVNIA